MYQPITSELFRGINGLVPSHGAYRGSKLSEDVWAVTLDVLKTWLEDGSQDETSYSQRGFHFRSENQPEEARVVVFVHAEEGQTFRLSDLTDLNLKSRFMRWDQDEEGIWGWAYAGDVKRVVG
ncbi:MAG: hypothetical protein EOP84_12180 [Verrucomicrobiaceae bacterium]|nr:MAG: hypothetical protein EOP84_12180 [Verrucomicrobiaceae bacterium]